ncbi:hypothetical protein V5799_027487 [Amblyomma americanum]|uniref:Uncharacterized protein n=1 Tax=Amblyomma americanum TaxID=6943 RepID=A0AAQ4DFK8_AMBAM
MNAARVTRTVDVPRPPNTHCRKTEEFLDPLRPTKHSIHCGSATDCETAFFREDILSVRTSLTTHLGSRALVLVAFVPDTRIRDRFAEIAAVFLPFDKSSGCERRPYR